MSEKIKKYAVLMGFNLLFLLTLLAITEFFLEKKNIDNSLNNTYARFVRLREFSIPNQNASVTPDPSLKKYAENLAFKQYAIATDSNAYIKSTSLVDSPSMKILFLGGSTTECRFVDDSLRFPSLVGKYFQSNGRSINTYNSGVSGNRTTHSLNILMNKAVHANFDMAVMMHNINDLVHLCYNGSYTNEGINAGRQNIVQLVSPEYGNHDLGFFKEFGASVRVKKAFQIVFPVLYNKMHHLKKPPPLQMEFNWEKLKPIGQVQYEQFSVNLQTFIAICKSDGITPVLMTQFNRITEQEFETNEIFAPYRERIQKSEITVADFCDYYQQFNEIIRKTAINNDILLIDLDKAIPKDKKYLYDFVHLNGEGAKLAAETIYNELNKHAFVGL